MATASNLAVISNSLTRMHKIAERINQRRQQLAEAIARGVRPESLEASVLRVRGASLKEQASFAIDEQLAMHDRLVEAHMTVRNALAEANVKFGVSRLLAEQEAVKRSIALLASIRDSQDDAVSQTQASAIFEARSAADDANRRGLFAALSVTSLCEDRLAHVVSTLQQAERQLAKLSDDLADLNASRIQVTLDHTVAAELGLA